MFVAQINVIFMQPLYEAVILCDCIIKVVIHNICRVTALDFQNDFFVIFKIFSISLIITWCKKFSDSNNFALNYSKL